MKPSKKSRGLLAGLIVGGAVVSVAALMAKQKDSKARSSIEPVKKKPLWRRLLGV